MKIWAFIPAGGAGSRMGARTPKQYLDLDGAPLIAHGVAALRSVARVDAVVVGVSESDVRWKSLRLEIDAVTPPGAERADTVLNGLRRLIQLGDDEDWVMVHDAVRPLVAVDDVERLIDEAKRSPHGALLAVPVHDTVKVAGAAREVVQTLDRGRLWRAATPQMFPLGALFRALSHCIENGYPVTDECGAMERMGHAPRIVRCRDDNIKITTPADLAFARWVKSACGSGS